MKPDLARGKWHQVFDLNGMTLHALFCAVVATLVPLVLQALIGKTFDWALVEGGVNHLVGWFFFLLVVLAVATYLLRSWYLTYFPIKIGIVRTVELQNAMMRDFLDMPTTVAQKKDHGYYYQVQNNGASAVGTLYGHISVEMTSSLVCFLLLLAVAWWILPLFGILVLCYVPLAALAVLGPAKSLAALQEQAFPLQDALLGLSRSCVERQRIIQVNRAQKAFYESYAQANKTFLSYILRLRRFEYFLYNLPDGLAGLFQVILLGVALYAYAQGQLSLGTVIFAWQMAGMVQMPLVTFFGKLSYYRVAKPYINRMKEYEALVAQPSGFEGKFTPSAHLASFEQAKLYANGEKERLLFAAPHMTLPQKGLVVIKGANGSGKSMLVNYLTGFGDATAFEGKSELNENLQKASYLTYPLLLTKGSFTDKLFGKGYDQEVATMLGIDFFEKEIDDEKVNLSFGEGQKLNLLRVLSSPSPVLVLDEPFTNLDKETIARLTEYLLEQKEHKGIIAITHSPELDAGADAIYAIRDGQLICEKG